MKKYDIFCRCLESLKKADFAFAENDNIYRAGVAAQFNLTFELAWKATQAVLQMHSVKEAESGSPREILKLAYKAGFIDDDDVWIRMLRERNTSTHIYDEENIDELITLIRDDFIPAFDSLAETLKAKISDSEESSWEK